MRALGRQEMPSYDLGCRSNTDLMVGAKVAPRANSHDLQRDGGGAFFGDGDHRAAMREQLGF